MENTPLISVVIPAYNSEQYLDECINSARNQILTDIEIILVNDGSTDSTLEIMQRHAAEDPRISVINKPNSGYGANMNRGFQAAQGKYIAILESDDYIELDMYQVLYSIAEKEGYPDVIASDFRRFYGEDPEDREFEYIEKSCFKAFYGQVFCPRNQIEILFTNNAMCSGIYKRSFIEEKNIRYNETPGASFQDNGFFAQVYCQAQAAYFVNNAFYNIRRDNENSSVKSKGKVYCMCDEYDFIRNWMIENKESLDPRALNACAKLRYNAYQFTLGRIDDSYRIEFLHRMADDFNYLSSVGELDAKFFSPSEWTRLQRVMATPLEAYFIDYYAPQQVRAAKQELLAKNKRLANQITRLKRSNANLKQQVESIQKKFEQSTSYRIGRAITAVPRKIKRSLNKGKTIEKNPVDQTALAPTVEKKAAIVTQPPEGYVTSTKELVEKLEEWYCERTTEQIDLENPITYNQKIQWLKAFDSVPLKSMLADKIAAREWVSQQIGDSCLIPLLGVWKSFDEIDFDKLPSRFVLKTNHGSGMNVVVTDKDKLDLDKTKKQFDDWMSQNYAFRVGWEMHYSRIKPLIFAEQFIDSGNEGLADYRFFCFSGVAYSVWVDVGSGTKQHLRNIYDLEWKLQPLIVNYPNLPQPLPKPRQLEQMIEMAQKLSAGFAHVRVDFYLVNDTVYFGELTFTPQSGLGRWNPPQYNWIYGEQLKLPEKSEFEFEEFLDSGLAADEKRVD